MQVGWLAELRRCNVHRVVIAYLAVAAVLLLALGDFVATHE